MKRILSLGIAIAWLGGCTSSPNGAANFTWYHPQGGEYLFAFDQKQCEIATAGANQRMSVNVQGPFFVCMEQRGYSLVDGQGRLLSAVNTTAEPAPRVSQQ